MTIPKHYSEKQEPSSRRDHQHFSTKIHPFKKITEVSPETCLQSSKSWRTNRSVSSQLPLRTTSALDLLQRLMANFELKPGLINMVQSNQFCGKAHEDASAHLQHFLEICSTFTISGVPKDAILLCLFPFSLLGRAKQWFFPFTILREEYYVGTLLHELSG